jgi:hypothetical protein
MVGALAPKIASGPVVLALTYLAALASYLALSAALIS